MFQHHSPLSINDLGGFLKISSQTLRNKLHMSGYLRPQNKVGGVYKISFDDCEKFIAKHYNIFYNDFVNRYSNGKRNESIMFQIPKG